MDIFVLKNNGSSWTQGQLVHGLTKKLWIERFRSPGEFTLKAPPLSEIRNALPLGSLISHTNTLDVMIVEDHEIVTSRDKEPVLTITGRSLDSFFEHRVATDDAQGLDPPFLFPGSSEFGTAWPYVLTNVTAVNQAVALIRSQVQTGYVERNSFALPHIHVNHIIDDDTEVEDRIIPRGPLNKAVIDILYDIGAGVKILRPAGDRTDIWITLHRGVNRKGTIQFTHEAGDLETARYFWSNRRDKDGAYVSNRHLGLFFTEAGTHTGFNRKVAYVDASDININPWEDGWAAFMSATKLKVALTRRAKQYINRRKLQAIVEATISKSNRYMYRVDYGIGDIVFLNAEHDMSNAMRVVEYIESEDENGESGFPTLVRAPSYD